MLPKLDLIHSFTQLIQIGDNFRDRETVVSAIKCYASMKGFCVRTNGSRVLECNRAGEPNSDARPFKAGQLKCGCKFRIKFKPSRHQTLAYTSKNGEAKRTSRPNWADGNFVTIDEAMTDHTGGCNPSPQQHVMQKSRSGKYISDLSQHALFTLCNACTNDKMVDSMVSSSQVVIV